MRGFLAVYEREFRSYFATPIAVVFLTVFLVLTGFFTFRLGNFFESGQADLRSFFLWHPWLYLFIAPAVSMRLWAEEKKAGTIELLLTLPISLSAAMLAKFVAAWSFMGVALLLTFPMPLTLGYLGDPDWGVVAAGYIGSFLMAGAFLSLGIFVSAATKNQIISFVAATALCLVLILIGFDPVVGFLTSIFPAWFVEQLANLSFPFHFDAIQRGVLDVRDILYFLSLIAASLLAGVIVIERSKAD